MQNFCTYQSKSLGVYRINGQLLSVHLRRIADAFLCGVRETLRTLLRHPHQFQWEASNSTGMIDV